MLESRRLAVIDGLRSGLSRSEALRRAGVSREAFYLELRRSPTFRADLIRATGVRSVPGTADEPLVPTLADFVVPLPRHSKHRPQHREPLSPAIEPLRIEQAYVRATPPPPRMLVLIAAPIFVAFVLLALGILPAPSVLGW